MQVSLVESPERFEFYFPWSERSYLDAKVLGSILPQVLPHKHISITVVEHFILTMLLASRPNSQIGQTRGIRVIIDGVPEILIPGKLGRLVELAADQEIDCDCQGLRHAIC